MPHNEDETDHIQVPNVECPLSEAEVEELKRTIDPLENVSDYGVKLYSSTIQFIYAKVT